MELTKNYQKLGEKYLGSSAGDLYIRIYAKYSEQDINNNRTKVQYQARAYFSGSYIYDQQSSGNVKGTSANQVNFSKSSSYSSGETTLGTTETWVTHEQDGTKSISASAYLTFPNWGWSGTANGSATLPNLHKPPTIETAEMIEINQDMINLGIANTTIVPYLSEKTITLHGTASDGATLSYKLEHVGTDYVIPADGFQASNVFNTNYRLNNITYDANNKARIIQRFHDNLNGEASNWLLVTINDSVEQPNVIPYNKPIIERTSTSIKRKSGNGTNLTDNKANLNLKATFYKANDVIGNNNSLTQIGYKIWESDATEPVSYTSLTPTISGGDVTISDLEINNVDFTKVYNYKIIIKDAYNSEDTILDGKVPLGQSLWSEYKNRVDFLELTKQHKPIYSIVTLYEDAIGSSGNITLSDSASNYDYIEIFYYNSSYQDVYSSVKVFEANGKNIELKTIYPNISNNRMYVLGTYYNCSGTSLNYIEGYGLAIANNNIYGVGQDTIKIVKVIGYK